MLPRAQRIRTAPEYGAVRRDGRTAGSALVGVGAKSRAEGPPGPARFGFVVSKRVGKATTRNLVKRRLRAVARTMVDDQLGWDIVVTARPTSATASFADLSLAMTNAVRRATNRPSAPRVESDE